MAHRKSKGPKMSETATTTSEHRPTRRKDLPATQGQLDAARSELKNDITDLRLEMRSGFKANNARFNEMESRFSSIDARFNEMESRFDKIDAKFLDIDAHFAKQDSKFDRMLAIIEEQRRDTKYTLDKLSLLSIFQEKQGHRISRLEKNVFGVESE